MILLKPVAARTSVTGHFFPLDQHLASCETYAFAQGSMSLTLGPRRRTSRQKSLRMGLRVLLAVVETELPSPLAGWLDR